MSIKNLFVVDANIIVSAFLSKEGKARQALDKSQTDGVVLMSVAVLAELQEVLARPKFDKYITVAERKSLLARLIKTAQFVDIAEVVKICRDPKDDKYLELAVNGKATYIVSGDADLLVLNPFKNIPILTVQDFLSLNLS
jgi:putative PIN family toxin of toxin-antitoxin system